MVFRSYVRLPSLEKAPFFPWWCPFWWGMWGQVGQPMISDRGPIISQNAAVARNLQDLSRASHSKCSCGQDRQSHYESLSPRKSARAGCKVAFKIRKVFLYVFDNVLRIDAIHLLIQSPTTIRKPASSKPHIDPCPASGSLSASQSAESAATLLAKTNDNKKIKTFSDFQCNLSLNFLTVSNHINACQSHLFSGPQKRQQPLLLRRTGIAGSYTAEAFEVASGLQCDTEKISSWEKHKIQGIRGKDIGGCKLIVVCFFFPGSTAQPEKNKTQPVEVAEVMSPVDLSVQRMSSKYSMICCHFPSGKKAASKEFKAYSSAPCCIWLLCLPAIF